MVGNELSTKTLFVTGATGFVGTNLVRKLAGMAKQVRCLIRSRTKAAVFADFERVILVEGDICEPDSYRDALTGVDIVINLAGILNGETANDFDRVNLIALSELARTAIQSAKLESFINISSLAAVGPAPKMRPLIETDEYPAVSLYGQSKRKGELALLGLKRTFPVVNLRPPIVYGPGDEVSLPLFKLAKRGLIVALGKKPRTYSIIHVDDLVAAIIVIASKGVERDRLYFVNGPAPVEFGDWQRVICRHYRKTGLKIVIPLWLVGFGVRILAFFAGLFHLKTVVSSQKIPEMLTLYWVSDSSAIERELGFKPQVDIEHGVRSTALWYEERQRL